MDVNPELLDEAVNPFKWVKSFFSKSKGSFEDLLSKNDEIKTIIERPLF